MTWPDRIERWRKLAIWEAKDIPIDLVLGIIAHESGGRVGAASKVTVPAFDVPSRPGGTVRFNHAMGLMQVIPRTLAGYNAAHPDAIAYFEDMTGDDERAARLQIRVGSWVYANQVRALYNYDKTAFPGHTPGAAPPNQLILALTAYNFGFGRLKKKLDDLRARGLPLTFEALANTFPGWGKVGDKWRNRPIRYARVIWRDISKYGGDPVAPPTTPPVTVSPPQNQPITWLLPLVLMALSWWLKNQRRETSA